MTGRRLPTGCGQISFVSNGPPCQPVTDEYTCDPMKSKGQEQAARDLVRQVGEGILLSPAQ